MVFRRALFLPIVLFAGAASAQFIQQGPKLVGTGSVPPTGQGVSVAISADGNTLAVGGPADNSDTGAVWVFVRSAGSWIQQGGKLIGSGAVGFAHQGSSVSLSADGNTLIVGGPGPFVNNLGPFEENLGIGAAWVFTRSGGVWTQQGGKLLGSGASNPAFQGIAVALSADGNTALVGGHEDANGNGATWVFVRSGGVWTQQGPKLVGSGGTVLAFQGRSVALSADGNTALVGGLGDNAFLGAAWVFVRAGGVWTQQGNKLVGTGIVNDTNQGFPVAISADGNTAIVGRNGDNNTAGAVWIFTRSAGLWSQQGNKLVGSGGVGKGFQGVSVSLGGPTGDIAAWGGFGDGGFVGATWVFTRSGATWTQSGNKLVGTGGVGVSGQGMVALSTDGSTLAVGGPGDDFSSVGATWIFVNPAATIPLANHGTLVLIALTLALLGAMRTISSHDRW